MSVWYLAVCTGCKLPPQPFTAAADRDTWADDHARLTGHAVERGTDPGIPAPPAPWSLLGDTDAGWPVYAAPPGTPLPDIWPDGQPVTPWADPWHDVAGDFRAVIEHAGRSCATHGRHDCRACRPLFLMPPPRPPGDDQ